MNLRAREDTLHPHAIQPIQQFAYSIRKNASDMAMVVDAMDLLHSGSFDAFGIVSSDADFTPLVMRLRGQNMRVFGFRAPHAPKRFVNAFSTFPYLDEPEDAANGSRARSSGNAENNGAAQAGHCAVKNAAWGCRAGERRR